MILEKEGGKLLLYGGGKHNTTVDMLLNVLALIIKYLVTVTYTNVVDVLVS